MSPLSITARLDRTFGPLLVLLLWVSCSPGTAQACTPVDATLSPPDAEGKVQIELRLPEQPWRGVTRERAAEWCLSLPAAVRVTKVRTFLATDRGDMVEAALHVVVHGYQLATRSEHKETIGVYDAWRSEPVDYVTGSSNRDLRVHAKAWTTVPVRPANIEFGVIIEAQPARFR
jgi:hypothetical protein